MRDIRVCAGAKRSVQFMICCILLAISGSPLTAATFERTYGGPDWQSGYSVDRTSDGGYVVSGTEGSSAYDAYLLRTDSIGNQLFERSWGGSGLEAGKSVKETRSHEYLIAGYTNSFGAGGYDLYLVRTDTTGNPVQEWTLGGVNEDVASALEHTTDGGFVISADMNGEMCLVKTDSLGDTVWVRCLGDTLSSISHAVQQTSDGGYLIGGERMVGFERDITVVKTDSIGNILWIRNYGNPGSQEAVYCLQETPDAGFVIGGMWEDRSCAFLMKIDSLGDSLWFTAFPYVVTYGTQQAGDGGYVAAGGSAGAPFFAKTDSLGNTLWVRDYGVGYFFTSLQRTPDNGFILAGDLWYSDNRQMDVYLVKTDENGIVARDAGTVSIDAPVQDTVFTDSTYPVTATVHNYRPSFVRCWVTASIGAYTDSAHTSRLLPDSSVQLSFADWLVPPDDSTTYTLTVCTHQTDDVDSVNDCICKSVFAYNPVGVEESPGRRSRTPGFWLRECEPNPFHASTTISYFLPAAARVTLQVFDVTGGVVATLADEEQAPGIHQVVWSAGERAAGVYFFRMQAGEFVRTREMQLVR